MKSSEKKESIKIVTTTFPIYDITKTLLNNIDNVDIKMLMDTGIDLHNYSPSSKDLVDILNSELFIYVGGESDEWVDDSFSSLGIIKTKKLNLMESIVSNLKEEELKEGMEDEKNEENEEETEYDEHIWLSIKNTENIVKSIKKELDALIKDTADKNTLSENSDLFIKKLNTLDKEFEKTINEAKEKKKQTTMIFADRFPFRYFVDDYKIDYFAAFKGCSAESEASFKTIVFLSDKLKEIKAKGLFVIDDSDWKIAKTVIETSGLDNINIYVLDSMQNKTIKNIDDGENYINIMEKNLKILSEYYQ